MKQFFEGSDAQFNWLKEQIQGQLYVFKNVELPASCTPDRSRIGFEYTRTNGYKFYIDKGIRFNGDNDDFKALLERGEKSFETFEDMVSFVKGLKGLYTDAHQFVAKLKNQENDGKVRTYEVECPKGKQLRFKFEYVQAGSAWRAYIVEYPTDHDRPMHGSHTYSWRDEKKGMYQVDWSTDVEKFENMVAISKMWAECAAKYIVTGKRFASA